jgi:hypothetical protein
MTMQSSDAVAGALGLGGVLLFVLFLMFLVVMSGLAVLMPLFIYQLRNSSREMVAELRALNARLAAPPQATVTAGEQSAETSADATAGYSRPCPQCGRQVPSKVMMCRCGYAFRPSGAPA